MEGGERSGNILAMSVTILKDARIVFACFEGFQAHCA